MTEDWSLEGKEISLDFNRRLLGQTKEDEIISVKVIPSKHVETLRLKLIEKIDTLDCTVTSKLKKWELIEEVLDIIDNSFGVKDD